jgi:hypothetical protein
LCGLVLRGGLPVNVARAPQQDGAVVAVPPLHEIGPLLDSNRRSLARAKVGLLGRDLPELRQNARESVVAAARAWFAQNGEPLPSGFEAASLLVAGHQPELFHPGVWVKHFALNGLARRHGATPLSLIVDNDNVKTTSLRMPAPPDPSLALGASSKVVEPYAHLTSVAFDRAAGESPWEEQAIQDRALFASFAPRVHEVMRGWGYEPILTEFWPEVLQQSGRTPLLGECFAAARRSLERRWGCHNLEVPLSTVCRTEAFAWFAAHILTDLLRFQAMYNDCVRAYRRANRIKSRNHPVPDLAADGDWLEAPFWGWCRGQARRHRLFARRAGDRLELRCGTEKWPVLAPDGERTARVWPELEAAGFKVRTRALTTTLFARLFLADLFIHGIGGGRYDELTDAIMRHFYALEPPGFLILSATRLLPLPTFAVSADDCRRLARELRDVHWNPQRHLDGDPRVQPSIERKQALIAAEPQEHSARRERFRELREVTERLRSNTAERELDLRASLDLYTRQVQANAVMRRRDYSFCLYPEAVLRPFCEQFL